MHEVIVVGAGPAGSVAAAVLAKQGCQVLLLDKAKFPRDKVCGDGIGWNSIRLLSELGLSLESRMPELHRCGRARGISPSGYVYEGSFSQKDGHYQHGYVIPRKRFDHVLWQFALQQGAEFERSRVTEPIVEKGRVCGVRGKADGKVVERRARITIAADGASSVIARFLHPSKASPRHYAVAMRSYFAGVQDLDRGVEFHFNQAHLPGYGWAFPMGQGMANIGVGLRLDVYRQKAQSLSHVFERFIGAPGLAERLSKAEPIGAPGGCLLPLASRSLQRAYDGALLVGDAGAFVSPLTGGGIYNAMETGRIAAEVALEALQGNGGSLEELRRFEVRWRSVLGRKLRVEAMVQRLLSWPGMLDLILRRMGHSERFANFVLNRF
jgi:geranylgeranyl reductase family protein